jgi:hypothetical protein
MDLPTKIFEVFYNTPVTEAELWKAVGRELTRLRQDKEWRFAERVAEASKPHGGVTVITVKGHEKGRVKTLQKLEIHARTLDVNLVDILQSILDRSGRTTTEANALLRRFSQLTSKEARGLLGMVDLLEARADQRTP